MKLALIIAGVLIIAIIIFLGIRQMQQNTNEDPLEDTEQIAQEEEQLPEEPEGERITTPEGLIFQDFVFGTGAEAQAGDTVTVHYVGTLENGTVFDASTAKGQPFSFRLGTGGVIEGWDIGVAGMKEGGIRELVIPPDLAYGQQERGPIPPGSTLTFVVQLLQVQKP